MGKLYTTACITHLLQVGTFLVRIFLKKKHIMGSSFEDLVTTSPTVKTDFKSDKWFEVQNILNFHIFRIKGCLAD